MTAPAAPAQTGQSAAQKPANDAGTAYVILEASTADASWKERGNVTARDTDSAILKYSEKQGNRAGKFIAIPAKRWKPKTITPETVTTLKLEDAK